MSTTNQAVSAIACLQKSDDPRFNRGIGFENELLFRCPADMNFFIEKTTQGKNPIVIMGHRNWDSIPYKFKPLKGRINIVTTRNPDSFKDIDNVYAFSDPIRALEWGKKYPNGGDIWVIGGQDIYTALLEECDYLYLTDIPGNNPADRFFPDYMPYFKHTTCIKHGICQKSGLHYQIHEYKRNEGEGYE